MGSTLVQFRCDEELKEETTKLYESLGLDLPTAFRLFMKRSLQVQGLPFAVSTKVSYLRSVEDMSGAELDKILAQKALAGEIHSARDVADASKEKYGM
ncbi:MAG: type II toxin-antitoxin system RelB/DinJ family antitoxin [Acidaminococcaceae bacterium]|nr:type II toxin-antitoxin system RelB/DinJ family antitoxin [Acidaminococcaceae bacterium]MDO4935055.1 type II toxin-antitoxin system RelB/DinJ family antitoxin [Phascolarctobacterium sp.]